MEDHSNFIIPDFRNVGERARERRDGSQVRYFKAWHWYVIDTIFEERIVDDRLSICQR